MAKFVIECPSCHRYAEAKTGFFARKRIDCTCGNVINVRTDRLSSRRCPNCGNEVVFDQRKGDSADCPVCHTPINTVALQAQNVELTCHQCGVALLAPKGSRVHTCPVCDHVNNVAERVNLKKIADEGMASIIEYQGDSQTLIWKHPVENFNYGSQLIVRESQEAVFLKDGRASDPLPAGRYAVGTERIPQLQEAIQYTPNPGGHFQSSVYFINKSYQMGVKWGTDSKINYMDPEYALPIALGASGDFNIRITDSRKLLLRVVGTTGGFRQDELSNYFRSIVVTKVKGLMAIAIQQQNISIFTLDMHLMEMGDAMRLHINQSLMDYGLEITEFNIMRFSLPDDEGFKAAKKLFMEDYIKRRESALRNKLAIDDANTQAAILTTQASAQAEANRLAGLAEADNHRAMALAHADGMRAQGATYESETARIVGTEAMKNGLPTGGMTGVMGDMATAGMAVGMMSGVMQMTQNAISQTPIPAPASAPASAPAPAPAPAAGGWTCGCGHRNADNVSFCPNCGNPKPVQPAAWNCPNCGMSGLTLKFCPNCGNPKPAQPVAGSWTCGCGHQNADNVNFCPNCGNRRPV